MDTIRNYLESLFIGVPRSTEIEKLKADLLANMEDHYHELMGEGKNEQEAIVQSSRHLVQSMNY